MHRRFLQMHLLLGVLLALFFLPASAMHATARPAQPLISPATTDAAADVVASTSLMFVENVGQFDDGARFQVRGAEGSLWLADGAIWITVLAPAVHETSERRGLHSAAEGVDETRQVGANIRLSFVGANRRPRLEPFERL